MQIRNIKYSAILLSSILFLFGTAPFSFPLDINSLKIQTHTFAKEKLTKSQKKINTQVLLLKEEAKERIDDYIRRGFTVKEAKAETAKLSNKFRKINKEGQTQLYIKYSGNKDQLINEIESIGGKVEIVSEQMSVIQAWMPQEKMDEIAANDSIKSIGLPDYAVTRMGSVITEGDTIHEADKVRDILGFTGSGIKVGVISDGINGINLSQASGDIPATYQAQSARADSNLNAGAEGLAMMEIVYDIAPSASLAFSNPGTSLEMLNAIQILDTTYNCKVIVDDLGFFGQPWFEDGSIADQVNSTTANGKLYISAAGNSGDREFYEGDFSGMSNTIGGTLMTVQNYNGAGDWNMRFIVPAGGTTSVYLQWNDKFGSSGNDYDLYLTDSSGVTVYSQSISTQNGNDDPYEWTYVTNSGGSPAYAYVVVRKYSGTNKRLKILINGGYLDEYYTAVGSIWGHQSADNTYAIGAIDHSTPNIIESFSSQGPVRIDHPSLIYRQKPDICGLDNVSVTGNGGFVTPFSGTSAAAPHIAGLAALVWSSNLSLTNTQVREKINSGAVDLGAADYDNIYGYGRANVYSSMSPLLPTVNPVTSPTNVTLLTLSGTKSTDTTEILINGSSSGVSYPTPTTWTAVVSLSSGVNNLNIKARNARGNESDEVSISIVLEDLTYSDPTTNASIRFPIGCSNQIPVVTAAFYNNPETLGAYPTAKQLIGSAVNFSCNIGTYSSPIYVTMSMPSGTVNPLPYYWDSVFNTWSNSGLTYVSKTNTSITFTATHLSVFGIFDVAGGMSNILIYPNPFQIGSSSGILFDALSGNETIRIYTISGELVRSHQVQYEQSWVWDTKNNSGRQCAMGVYLYLITNTSGQKRIGKIALTK